MLYRIMPKTGDRLSILGFGAMRLPIKDKCIDEERATSQIRYAIDQGVNYIDTAWPYHAGESEPFLGRALSAGYREKVKLATKLPTWLVNTREDMDQFLNSQLERLQTQTIDYYLIHALNGKWWDKMQQLKVMDFLKTAKTDGRIVNTGFSFHGQLDDFKRIIDEGTWDFCQIQYNYLDEEYQAGTEGLNYAADNGLGIIIMEPLRGGNLGNPAPPLQIEKLWNQSKQKRTPAEWALRWVWDRPEVTLVLSGMNEEDHINQNLSVANKAYPKSLSEEELEIVHRVALKYCEIMKVSCTGCEYCMPCPEGVNISGCFDIYNTLHMYKQTMPSIYTYVVRNNGILSGNPSYASQCTQCEECLDKCPQELAIPDLLEDVVQDMEGKGFNEITAKVKKTLTNT
jgi:uncharacterized protein